MNESITKKEIIDSLELWIEEQRLEQLTSNTLKQYKNAIVKFLGFLKKENINIIDKQAVIDYRFYLDKISQSVSSKNIWIISLNKYLKYLNKQGLCIKQIKSQKKYYSLDCMTDADFKRFLRKAKELNMIQDFYIIKILGKTGIRVGELLFFTVENLKKENNNIIKVINKGKERDILIPKKLARDLRKYARDNKIKKGTLFPSSKKPEQMIAFKTINFHLKKIAGAAKINLQLAHAHAFRDYFAIMFLEKYPKNELFLADLLGHASLETTRIYTRLSLKQKLDMVSKLEE